MEGGRTAATSEVLASLEMVIFSVFFWLSRRRREGCWQGSVCSGCSPNAERSVRQVLWCLVVFIEEMEGVYVRVVSVSWGGVDGDSRETRDLKKRIGKGGLLR
ncbi:hypothetical protein HAX54_038603 [Datura stramonium]|uniref:Uncharacterized protein n=1 Tax=Datura stramonium TaxID=4076 RepID=A0ABS8VNZ8_DATST|nr:hypothetical protein [Datura stramonium]